MASIKELLQVNDDNTLSFGDYTLAKKTKVEDFEFQGDLYKVKTYSEITKLERNGMFVFEAVPGAAVDGYYIEDEKVAFAVSGNKSTQITVELEPEKEYTVNLDGVNAGNMSTNLSGKLSISVDLEEGKSIEVEIVQL